MRPIGWVVLGGLLVRTLTAASLPIFYDEALYWVWAQRLDWGYVHQPPLIAYLVALTTLPADGVLWVRLSPLLIGALTTYAVYLLGRDLFGERAGLLAAALCQVTPLIGGFGFLAVPDAPLLLAWVMATRFIWQGVHGQRRGWLAAGFWMGVGLLSKLFMVWHAVGTALFLILRAPRWLRRPEPYLAAALAAIIFLPVILWNAAHDWAGVRFLAGGRVTAAFFGVPGWRFLLQTYVWYAWLLAPAFVWALWIGWRRWTDERFAYLVWTVLPLIVITALAAIPGAAAGHWVAPAALSLAVILGAMWNRPLAGLAGGNAALYIVWLALFFFPAISAPGASEIYVWEPLTARVRQEVQALGPGSVVLTPHYQIAAVLTYYTRATIPVIHLSPVEDPVWPSVQSFRGAPAVAVTYAHQPADWTRCAAQVVEAPAAVVRSGPHVLARFRLYRLDGLVPEGCALSDPGGAHDHGQGHRLGSPGAYL